MCKLTDESIKFHKVSLMVIFKRIKAHELLMSLIESQPKPFIQIFVLITLFTLHFQNTLYEHWKSNQTKRKLLTELNKLGFRSSQLPRTQFPISIQKTTHHPIFLLYWHKFFTIKSAQSSYSYKKSGSQVSNR